MTAEAYEWKNALRRFTNGDFSQTFGKTVGFTPRRHQLLLCVGLYPVNGSICSRLYHLQGSFPSVCTAMSVRLPSYMSCLISLSHLSYTVYSVVQVTSMHSYIHTNYIHTSILSHIHIFMRTQHIHRIIHTWLHQSPGVLFGGIPSVRSLLSCFKLSFLHNGQLEFSLLSCFKWSVLHKGQLEFIFLSCFKWSVLHNGQHEFTLFVMFQVVSHI
jgi:hypothetical protein